MPQITRAQLVANHPSRRMLTASLLLALVLLTHVVIMLSERHMAAMGTIHALNSGVAMVHPGAGEAHPSAQSGENHPPSAFFGDCPAQQAILPFLLALLLITVIATRCLHAQARLDPAPPASVRQWPTLSAYRRRAMLQVFLI